MYLARVMPGITPRVYPLVGSIYFPRAWKFVSYRKGAAAIGETQTAAIVAARKELRGVKT